MQKKEADKTKGINKKQGYVLLTIAVAAAIIAIVFFVKPFSQERSIAAYCKVLSEEKEKQGDTDDYGLLAKRYAKLERVAPDDIHGDVARLQSTLETMHNDPDQALTTGLGALDSGNRIDDWEEKNCQ